MKRKFNDDPIDAAAAAMATAVVVVVDDDPLKGVLELGNELGRGAYGRVCRAVDCATQTQVAVKIVERGGEGEQFARSEVEALTRLRGAPFVADLRWHVQSTARHYIVMGLAAGGTLFDRVVTRGPLREPELGDAVAALLHAASYAHTKGIAHLDIKLDNILLDSDGRVQALADWGFASTTTAGKQPLKRGTMGYAAPELMSGSGDEVLCWAVDVFALGVCFFAMATGHFPFVATTPSSMHTAMRRSKCDWTMLGASSLSLVELVQACLAFDPLRRPSAAQLLRRHSLTRQQPPPPSPQPIRRPHHDDAILCVN
jgi:serine/threonine-protein kinase